ncbi:unnamed protein product [Orchesella dallaii]|uniref:Uncharacterized protein n=1 Tax=Orchesella dallaii TaxID=48710 RepID=A0ABP1RMJ3_9HEXA
MSKGETPSKKRIESEVATPEQQTVALSHVQVIDVLQWLPEEKAKQVDTWINIESEWNLEKVPGVETVKAIIRGIIFNWEIVSQYQSTLDSSPNAWKDFSWDHTESTTMTWPSAPIRSYLKSSLVKLVCGIVKEGLETSCSSASMMNMSTSSTRVPTPTDHAGVTIYGMGSQSHMSFVDKLRLDATVGSSNIQTGIMCCSILAAEEGMEFTTKWTAPIGDFVLDMAVYQRNDILGKNQDIWWKTKDCRVQIPFSKESQIQYHVEQIKQLINVSLPPPSRRETKSKQRSNR